MTKMYLLKILSERYYQAVLLVSLFLGWFLVPQRVILGPYAWLVIPYIALFALLLTCIIANLKEKISLAKMQKKSMLSIIGTAFGFGVLQMCALSPAACTSITLGLVGLVFPVFVQDIFAEFGLVIIVISIVLQLIGLYSLKCFEQVVDY